MADQVRVFVSHHHSPEEDAFTARLVADLEAAGADVWVDVASVGADDFQKRINQALATCEWFVLILTPESIASPWVEMEMHAAIRLKAQGHMRRIIQVMTKQVPQELIPPTWGIFAHFDATRDYSAVCNLILRELGISSPLPPVGSNSAPGTTPREKALERRAWRTALRAKKQQLEEDIQKRRNVPHPWHYDSQLEHWKNELTEIENQLLEEDGRWHPTKPVLRHTGGAMDDYVETWEFPCCNKVVTTDGPPSQYRSDGCESY